MKPTSQMRDAIDALNIPDHLRDVGLAVLVGHYLGTHCRENSKSPANGLKLLQLAMSVGVAAGVTGITTDKLDELVNNLRERANPEAQT